jgi:hypothetical protein
MPLRDLLGSPRDQPYAASDPRNPKNYYKVIHDKRKADEAEQDRRMSEAYADGKLARYQPGAEEGGGVARQSAVEAGARERKIPGLISHNDALYFATLSGWTHAERWRPSREDEAERLRREAHGVAVEAEAGSGSGSGKGDVGGDGDSHGVDGQREGREEQRRVEKAKEQKKSIADRVKSFVFGAAGVTKE